MRVAWATDLHLNFVEPAAADRLCARIREAGAEAVLLGGDTAEAGSLVAWIRFLDARLDVPVHFVLGNHDYYGGDIASVREAARSLRSETLGWLPEAGVVPLTGTTALVGHGGWGDARLGDFAGTEVILNDYVVIADLRDVGQPPGRHALHLLGGWENKAALGRKLRELGDEAAAILRPSLETALESHPEVLVLTHVPPLAEACWHDGKVSNDDWLPGFTCGAIGALLLEAAETRPDRRITVLCGHTHGEGEARPRENLRILTQGAAYRRPDFRRLDVR
jgi:Icc protein